MKRAAVWRSARSIGCVGVLVAVVSAAALARAANYELVAEAHCDGESTTDVEIGSVSAQDINPDEPGVSGVESYSASASGQGVLSASAASDGVPPSQVCSNRAVAKIVETLKIPTSPVPSGPVTISVGFAGSTSAGSTGGSIANASAVVRLEPFSLTCYASTSENFGPQGSCPGGSVGILSVTRTFSLLELANRQWEIDVEAQVDATLELFASLGHAEALALGGLWVGVEGGGVESYTWTGTNTSIPTPEPGAPLLAATVLASLAAVLRRRRGRGRVTISRPKRP